MDTLVIFFNKTNYILPDMIRHKITFYILSFDRKNRNVLRFPLFSYLDPFNLLTLTYFFRNYVLSRIQLLEETLFSTESKQRYSKKISNISLIFTTFCNFYIIHIPNFEAFAEKIDKYL